MKTRWGVPMFLGVAAASCASPTDSVATGDDANLDETPQPRGGNTIHSPSVDPNKTYWGSRTISLLVKVGALTPAEAAVARRADGIIANSPPNDRIGVDELAVLESPERIRTLFPEEQAVIPKLWQILAIDAAPNYPLETPTIRPQVVDGYATAPTQLPTSDPLAKRIQLTFNSDGNAGTISGIDVEKAYGDRGSYLPSEVAAFRSIVRSIAEGGKPIPVDAQRIVVPETPSRVLHDFSGAKVWLDTKVAIQTSWYSSDPKRLPVVGAFTSLRTENPDAGTKWLLLSRTTGVEGGDVVNGELRSLCAVGTTCRIEQWKDGKRSAQIDVEVRGDAFALAPIPFGYSVIIGGVRFDMRFRQDGYAVGVYFDSTLHTSTAGIPSGSYYLSGRAGERVDVFANGRALVYAGGAARNCYPLAVDRYNLEAVAHCGLLNDDGKWQESISFAVPSPASDSPAIASSTLGGGAFLYPL